MRIAFVVQRCGREVNGGAELHCLQVAQRLSSHYETEVLTTCALDYTTWDNFSPPGPEQNGGTIIRRFPVDQPRDAERFDALSARLFEERDYATLAEQEEWMRAQGPMSRALLTYISSEKENYDAFVFFGYLYATTYFGLPLVSEKALLAPLAHDEWPIYLSMWERLFSLPQHFIFNTAAERQFIRTRFPALPLPGRPIGVGIEAPARVDTGAFVQRYGIAGPFLLYVGRIEEAKGCKELFEYFIAARRAGAIDYKLVTIGREAMPVPFHDDIIHLGFVSDAERWAAMAACDWLVVPSPHESLSMVLLEVWSMCRPAVVNGRCDVLRVQCQESNGGVWYESYEEWLAILRAIDSREREKLGLQGQAFVRERYAWARVVDDYSAVLQGLASMERGKRCAIEHVRL